MSASNRDLSLVKFPPLIAANDTLALARSIATQRIPNARDFRDTIVSTTSETPSRGRTHGLPRRSSSKDPGLWRNVTNGVPDSGRLSEVPSSVAVSPTKVRGIGVVGSVVEVAEGFDLTRHRRVRSTGDQAVSA